MEHFAPSFMPSPPAPGRLLGDTQGGRFGPTSGEGHAAEMSFVCAARVAVVEGVDSIGEALVDRTVICSALSRSIF